MSKLSKIVVVLMMIAFVGLSSAAVVNYLSNQVDAEVDVDTPFTVRISDDEADFENTAFVGSSLDLGEKFGGETSVFYIEYKNQANQPIEMQIETLIKCDASGYPGVDTLDMISHEDFEDDQKSNNYDKNVKHGITATGPVYNEQTGNYDIMTIPLNFHPRTNDRNEQPAGGSNEDCLAMVGGIAKFQGELVWDAWFPADTTMVVMITMHHAPNAVGTYTLTSEVQDDATPWINPSP